MLNISPNSIQRRVDLSQLESTTRVNLSGANRMFVRWLVGTMILFVILMFLPWTQNIQTKGKVTTLRPEQRPQTIHSTIAGRVEHWFVREGQLVEKGDTILFLSEIKTEYFDPELASRTEDQVKAKSSAIGAYEQKVTALEDQLVAMRQELQFKMAQLRNKIRQTELKIQSDSIELEQKKIDFDIANRQLDRTQALYDQGIKSLTDLEDKKLKLQSTQAKLVEVQNKLESSRNELDNARLALNTTENEYGQKIAKTEAERFSTLSTRYDADASLNKLRIESANYKLRNSFYYIVAPQRAYITKALTPGIGETVKEGEAVVSIVPADYELAVELYVKPIDLPLVKLGQEVGLVFDGWPTVVFSGWPSMTYGTFYGKVVAIDNNIDANGRFRVLLAPEESEKPWPDALRPGAGSEGIVFLNDVFLWYEIWRKLNGFPPDFYQNNVEEIPKLKAPLKSIPK